VADARQKVTYALLAATVISFALLQSLVAPALPELQRALHTSVDGVSWVMTAYLLSASIATPLIGRLGDLHGKVRLLVAVLAVLAAGTVVAALATSLPVMLVGRVLQGASGGLLPLAFGIIRDQFPHERVAGAVGVVSSMGAVGAGTGVVLAGPIVDALSIHALFWLPLIPLVATAIGVHMIVPEPHVSVPGRVNWSGAALLSLGLAAVLLAVSKATVWHWLSAQTIAGLTLGVLLLVLWVRSEARSEFALVDMRLMRVRGVWTTNAVSFVLGFGLYVSFILIPQYVETPPRVGYGFGASVTEAGVFLLPMTLAILTVGSLSGRLERRFGSKPPLLAGGAVSAAGYGLLAIAHAEQWQLYLGALLLGAGIGLSFAAIVNVVIENVRPTETGVATGMNAVMRTVGGAFGGSAMAAILGATVGAGGYPSASGYTTAFAVCAITLALGSVLGLLIPRRRPAEALAGVFADARTTRSA
jgi:MFS family permease